MTVTAEDLAALNHRHSRVDTVPWWHTFHRWTKWQCGEAQISSVFKALAGPMLVQTRACVRCNFEQVRPYRVTP
jgi:hypothetical protein